MKFCCKGHKNISAAHRNTLEFTKDKSISLEGDCIIGVEADFGLGELKKFISDKRKIKIKIKVNGLIEEINCEINHNFNDSNEIIVRKTSFISERTLGINANKAAIDLSRELAAQIKKPSQIIEVELCTS